MKNSTKMIAITIICIFAISMIISIPIASAAAPIDVAAVQAITRDAPGAGAAVVEFKLGQIVYVSYSVTGPVTLYVRDEEDNSIDVSWVVTASGDGGFSFKPEHMGVYGIYSSVSSLAIGTFEVIKPDAAIEGAYEFVTPTAGSTNVDHTATTGVDVNLNGVDNGQEIVISTLDFGTTQPPNTGIAITGGTVSYYDVQVIKPNGDAVNSGAIATVSITNPAFTSSDVMSYWDGSAWVQATNQHYDASTHTITGDIPASALTGTEVAVGGSGLFITPEYALGALGALIACFAAVGCVAVAKKRRASK